MKNLEGRELFGITLGEGCKMEKDSWKDYFEIADDDGEELTLRFTETFSNDFFETEKEIKYNLYLQIFNGENYENCGNWVYLYMLPKLDFLHKSVYENYLDYYDGTPKNKWIEKDVLIENYCPVLCKEKIDFPLNEDWNSPKLDELLETATCVLPNINRLIGFYMDRPINLIGTTNWDCLESLMDGSDWTHQAMDRWKEKQ